MRFEALYIDANAGAITANVMFAQPPRNEDDQPSVLCFSKVIEFSNTTYYFEVNDQSYSSYGGLDAVHLTRNRIKELLSKLQLIFSEDPGVLTVDETVVA